MTPDDEGKVPEMPSEFMSSLLESVVSMHEWYCSLVEGGFKEREALYLIACCLMQGPREDE